MGEHTDVQTYLDRVTPDKRRRDAARVLELLARVTGQQPAVAQGMVGFGRYHYRYESGREGDAPAAAFAARKAALTIYLPDGSDRHRAQLERLGPHTTGVGCLYIKNLDLVDLSVLETVVAESYRTVTADISQRGSDGEQEHTSPETTPNAEEAPARKADASSHC